MCRDMIVISPKVTLISTVADQEVWTRLLTRTWQQDPNECAEKIKFRASRDGPSIYAQVEATQAQLSAARARRGHDPVQATIDQPKTLQATVSIPIGTSGQVEAWLPQVMNKLTTNGLIPISRSTQEDGLGVREWKPLYDADGTWLQKVVVQFRDEQELRRAHRVLQGKRVSISGHEAAITVESKYIDLERGTRDQAEQDMETEDL